MYRLGLLALSIAVFLWPTVVPLNLIANVLFMMSGVFVLGFSIFGKIGYNPNVSGFEGLLVIIVSSVFLYYTTLTLAFVGSLMTLVGLIITITRFHSP